MRGVLARGSPEAASFYQLSPSASGAGEPGEHPARGPLLPACSSQRVQQQTHPVKSHRE